METAVQLKGDDAVLRYRYGALLVQVDKKDAALEQLAKSAEAEPYYAAPHQLMGRVIDAQNKSAEAVAHYQRFLALAAQSDPQVEWTKQRVALLTSSAAAKP
jgi:predicted negative regulator of RcsB-dependent stress response